MVATGLEPVTPSMGTMCSVKVGDVHSQLNVAATAASKPLVNRLFGNAVFGRIRTRYSISSLQEYMANARYSSATAKERTHGNSPL